MTKMQTNGVLLIGLGSVSMSRLNPPFCNKGLFKPITNKCNFINILASTNSSSLDIKVSQNNTSNQLHMFSPEIMAHTLQLASSE